MSNSTWSDYCEKTRSRGPRSLLTKALSALKNRDCALDLGSGALNDSKFLLEQGFNHVTALDMEPVAESIAKALPPNRFSYIISDFESYQFPENQFDLINAQFSLPFNPPETFNQLIDKIYKSLNSQGVFTGQFFGDKDEWNQPASKLTFHSCAQAKKVLSPFSMIFFAEREDDQTTVAGNLKHWHVIDFIVRKDA